MKLIFFKVNVVVFGKKCPFDHYSVWFMGKYPREKRPFELGFPNGLCFAGVSIRLECQIKLDSVTGVTTYTAHFRNGSVPEICSVLTLYVNKVLEMKTL